jgi:hypothetical protein
MSGTDGVGNVRAEAGEPAYNGDGAIMWDTQTWKERPGGFNSKGKGFHFPVFTPDSKLVVGVTNEGLKLFDAETGAERASLGRGGVPPEQEPFAHTTNPVFVAGGKRLVWGGQRLGLGGPHRCV